MKFLNRVRGGPRAAAAAPMIVDLSPDRAFHQGERVTLMCEQPAATVEVHAVVVQSWGARMRVRVLSDVHGASPDSRLKTGDEFEVSPSNIFSVRFST